MYRNCAYRYVDSINWVVEIITGDVSIIITGVPEHGRTIFHRQNCQTFPLSLPLFLSLNLKTHQAEKFERPSFCPTPPFRQRGRKGRNYTAEIAKIRWKSVLDIRRYLGGRDRSILGFEWPVSPRMHGVPGGHVPPPRGASAKWNPLGRIVFMGDYCRRTRQLTYQSLDEMDPRDGGRGEGGVFNGVVHLRATFFFFYRSKINRLVDCVRGRRERFFGEGGHFRPVFEHVKRARSRASNVLFV